MSICEEYIKRHGLNVPLVKRIQTGYLFFQTEPLVWKLFTLNWQNSSSHPGHYVMRISSPNCDGWRCNFFTPIFETEVFADQYETMIFDFSKNVSKVTIGEEEMVNAGWEVALQVFDSALAKDNDSLFLYDVLSDRNQKPNTKQIERFMQQIPGFSQFWQQNILRFLNNRLDWLGELIRNRNGH